MELVSVFSSFLPGFQITQIEIEPDQMAMVIYASIIPLPVLCPDCHHITNRVHSYYSRIPHDISYGFYRLRLHLTVRRMRCVNQLCRRKTFAERMPEFLPFHAQRTLRQTYFLKKLVFEVNGQAGSRICQYINMIASSDTLTRIARLTSLPTFSEPKVIGIDDWALRKGIDYGTLIVDLERHRPIAVLPDRTVESIKNWLKEHPTIEVICRDRYGDYIEGIQQGAPNAIQITDRWHLLHNLSDAVQGMFWGYEKELQEVANLLAQEDTGTILKTENENAYPKAAQKRRTLLQEKLLEVKRLAKEGYSNRKIGKMLGIHRETVGIYKHVDRVPIRGGIKPYTAAPYEKYIIQKWNQGCHSAKEILHEIKGLGYTGSIASVYRYLSHLGMQPGIKEQPQLQPRRLTARQAAWLLTLPEEKLDSYQKRYRFALCEKYSGIREASDLANGFIKILQEQKTDKLSEWIEKAQKCSVSKIRYFAKGLENDFSAVQAAVSFDWSNGQLEGQVNRLKTIKRMMYGRAKFDLLRKRVLCY